MATLLTLSTKHPSASSASSDSPQNGLTAINNLIHVPSFETVTYGKNSIKYHCAKLWNDMFPSGFIQIDDNSNNDIHLSKINNIHYFKKVMKKHFMYKYSSEEDDFIYY